MILVLDGKTRHGKNRIREHGSSWTIVREQERIAFSDEKGPWLLLESQKNSNHIRWIHAKNDKDFTILKLEVDDG